MNFRVIFLLIAGLIASQTGFGAQVCFQVPSIELRGAYTQCITVRSPVLSDLGSTQFSPSMFGGGQFSYVPPTRSSGGQSPSLGDPGYSGSQGSPGVPGTSEASRPEPSVREMLEQQQRQQRERDEGARAEYERSESAYRERQEENARREVEREREEAENARRQREIEAQAMMWHSEGVRQRRLLNLEAEENTARIALTADEIRDLKTSVNELNQRSAEVDSVVAQLAEWNLDADGLSEDLEVESSLVSVDDQSNYVRDFPFPREQYLERLGELTSSPEMLNLLRFTEISAIATLYRETLYFGIESILDGAISTLETGGAEWLLTLADVGTSLTPVVGEVRDVVELISGRDAISGRELTQLETAWIAGSISLIGVGRVVSPVRELLDYARRRIGEGSIRSAFSEMTDHAWMRSIRAIRTYDGVVEWHPSIATRDISTFRSSKHHHVRTTEPLRLWRVYDSGSSIEPLEGRFWSPIRPQGRLQSEMDLAILPEYTRFDSWVEVEVPAGTEFFVGIIAPQSGSLFRLGGGLQAFFPDMDGIAMREIRRGTFEL